MSDFLLSLERRRFLALTGISAFTFMTGCASVDYARNPAFNYYRDSRRLIIDAHCHLMNEHDSSRDFVDRHLFEAADVNPIFRAIGDFFAWSAAGLTYGAAMTATDEISWLDKNLKELQKNPKQFYEIADKNQEGLFSAHEYYQKTGMFSNRTRNAARMLIQFPQVDIFTPAMVDFYEGDCNDYSVPEVLAEYYSKLNIASSGRFLPLISFHPERALDYEHPYGESTTGCTSISPIELVKKAIEEMGFIGVKLHPSSGFSPSNNVDNGCENTSSHSDGPLRDDQNKAKKYDQYLAELFAYCRGADVPILTHSGNSIPANRSCMEDPKKKEIDWTNAPPQWFTAMDIANAPEVIKDKWGSHVDPALKLRVCLAHFSGGLVDKQEDNLSPNVWLQRTLEEMPNRPDLYIDISAMSEWFEENNKIEAYRNKIKEIIVSNPSLKKQLMYGSDWHMPGTAKIGSSYLTEFDEMIAEIQSDDLNNPNEYSSNIMGQNAIEFYGLSPGRHTRQRLEAFYQKNNVDLRKISWMKKIT